MKLTEIRCQNKINPIGIDDFTPDFSWKYAAEKGLMQRSYRITVFNGKTEVWDSGEVFSNDTCGIEYGGEELKPSTVYNFYVETTAYHIGEDGLFADKMSGTFETGLFGKFNARWIGLPAHFSGSSLYLRNIKDLKKDVVKARMYICGLGYYEVYVNGRKVGSSVLNPGFTDWNKRVLYDVYDVTELYRKGKNQTAVMLGNGWHGNQELLCQVNVEYADGSKDSIETGFYFDWFVTKSPIIKQSIYEGEEYDARREEEIDGFDGNFSEIDYFKNGWMFSVDTEGPKGQLIAQGNERIEVVRNMPVKSINKLSEKEFVYDMGVVFAGWAKIKVRGERGAKVILKYAEGVKKDGKADQNNLRSATATDVYILKGKGVEEYAPRFTYHGFRYIQVNIEGEAEILELEGEFVRNSVAKIGEFKCSDEIINAIHTNAVRTEESNMHSIPTDCPQRDERFGWLNDISSRLDQALNNFDVSLFYKKFFDDIADTQDGEGAIADTAPFKIANRPADPVCICYLLIPYRLYQLYGNKNFLERSWAGLKKWVDYLLKNSENYLLNYGYYGDWAPPLKWSIDGTPLNKIATNYMVSSAYLYWYCTLFADICKILGKENFYREYYELSEKVKDAFNKKYFDFDKGHYRENSQSGNGIPLKLGLCPSGTEEKIAEIIDEDIKANDYHLTTGNQGYKHLIEVMADRGYVEDIYKLIVNPTYPGWGYMIASGATSIWERWEAEMNNQMNSFCHPMLGSIDAWFYRYLGGIYTDEKAVGGDKWVIKPYILSALGFTECSIETSRGKLEVKWFKEGEYIRFEITIPPTVTAKFIYPEGIKGKGEKEITLYCGKYVLNSEISEIRRIAL